MLDDSVWRIIQHGGVVMPLLLVCSVVSVAIALERSWTLMRAARGAQQLHERVHERVTTSGLADAVALCGHDPSPLGAIYWAVLTCAGGAVARRELATRKLAQTARQVKRSAWLLGTIGSLAPFIGLLGTVVGIMRAFESMATTGAGGFAVVAAGISEALVATAAGLLVGILAIFAYNAIVVRANTLIAELRDYTDELLAALSQPAPREGALPRAIQPR